jgi:hypothetical protein
MIPNRIFSLAPITEFPIPPKILVEWAALAADETTLNPAVDAKDAWMKRRRDKGFILFCSF